MSTITLFYVHSVLNVAAVRLFSVLFAVDHFNIVGAYVTISILKGVGFFCPNYSPICSRCCVLLNIIAFLSRIQKMCRMCTGGRI